MSLPLHLKSLVKRASQLTLLASVALAGTALVTPSSSAEDAAEAPKPSKFKIATIAPSRSPWAKLLKLYRKRVKAKNVGLIPKTYFDSVKGDEQSIVRQVYKGSLQMGGVSTAALATVVPEMDILELPYAFPSLAAADRKLEEVRPIVEKILNAKGLMLLMYSENGYRSFAVKGKCIRKPSDLKALKMRAQESPVHVETYRAFGADPVTISVSEVVSSLDRGVVVGFDNTPIISQALGWSEQITHFSTTRHIYQPALIIMNKQWFDGLTPEQQKTVREEGAKLEAKGRKFVRKIKQGLMDNFKAAGVEVCELTDAERAVFRDKAQVVWKIREEQARKRNSALGLELIAKMRGK